MRCTLFCQFNSASWAWWLLVAKGEQVIVLYSSTMAEKTLVSQCVQLFSTPWTVAHQAYGIPTHGILQEGILEWVAISFCRGSSRPRGWTQVSCIAGRFFTVWATEEDPPWRRAWHPTPVFLPGESPWTEEPGRLQSTGSQRGRYDWSHLTQHTHSL